MNLQVLNLGGTKTTDAALAEIGKLPNLEKLTVGGFLSKITDQGVAHLTRLEGLESLDLSFTGVTDEAIPSRRTERRNA